jgi:alpha-D-ribose 1-methylphosphonate 5-triphosphate diphosphatase
MRDILITGGQMLRGDVIEAGDVALVDGVIADTRPATRFDAAGLLVMPGLIDLHGDAFERQIQPRPAVDFPMDLALADSERQLLANGITTAFHAVTLSWEPGLRSPTAWRHIVDGLAARAWTCDMRVHLRWEAFNLDALDMAIDDIEAGRVHLLSFNDHTQSIIDKLETPSGVAKYAGRAGMKVDAFRALALRVAERAAEVPTAVERIAAAARAAGLPMASHDDDTIAARIHFAALGAGICEFPMNETVATFARDRGDASVMGCPNVVRGGSHLGWASAAEMAERGLCSVLASDYFYPAMLQAPFVMADRGVLGLGQAWALVSGNAAAAAKLSDRGRLESGLRGDVVVVDPVRRQPVATFCAGQMAWISADGAARLHPAG